MTGSVNVAGDEVEFDSEDPQRDLHRLLGWAERKGVQLEALQVRRPSLEDIFLELTDSGGER
jgi:ABC-2 type transport system ATP-binding protein